MLTQLLAVQINDGLVIRGTEVDVLPLAGMLLIVELAPIPYRPFIEHPLVALRVPVSRNIQNRRRVEAVLDEIALAARLLITKEPCLAVFKRIDDGMPRAIEAHRGPAGN